MSKTLLMTKLPVTNALWKDGGETAVMDGMVKIVLTILLLLLLLLTLPDHDRYIPPIILL